jgi:hypothetical protein
MLTGGAFAGGASGRVRARQRQAAIPVLASCSPVVTAQYPAAQFARDINPTGCSGL